MVLAMAVLVGAAISYGFARPGEAPQTGADGSAATDHASGLGTDASTAALSPHATEERNAAATGPDAVSPGPPIALPIPGHEPPDGPPGPPEAPSTPPAAPTDPTDDAVATLTQTVEFELRPGPLEIDPGEVTLVLKPRPASGVSPHYVGELPPVRVVDATGSLAGWEATARIVEVVGHDGQDARPVPEATVRFHPHRPEVVYGSERGLRRGNTTVFAGDDLRPFFSAVEGQGGGTYEAGAILDARLPRTTGAESVTVTLRFAVDSPPEPVRGSGTAAVPQARGNL